LNFQGAAFDAAAVTVRVASAYDDVLFSFSFFVEVGLLNCFSWVLSQPIS
jgi:hypothetical protein